MQKDFIVAAGAIGFNYAVTMAIIFVNKFLFLKTAFPILSLAAAHLCVTSLFTRAAHAGGIFKLRHAEWDAQIFAIACLQGGAIALGQASLKINSVGFFQVRSIHWSPYDRVGVVDADP